jgi:beta-galactosidase
VRIDRALVEPALPGARADDTGRFGTETWLTVGAVLRADTAWAEAGHVVSSAQLELDADPSRDHLALGGAGRRARAGKAAAGARRRLGPAVFDGATLVELAGEPVGGPFLSLWRAPIDNDTLQAASWREAGLDRLVGRVERAEAADDVVTTRTRYAAADSRLAVWMDAVWRPVGETAVAVRIEILPSGGWDLVWPRVGMRFDLPTSIDTAEWFGTGPLESYADSRRAARVGRFAASVEQLGVAYARPQETGHRGDLRWLELAAGGVPWVRIDAVRDARRRLPGFTLSRHTAEELTAAAHPHELPPAGRHHLYVDAAQHGLGSAACGPDVLPDYVLRPEARTITLLIEGVSRERPAATVTP